MKPPPCPHHKPVKNKGYHYDEEKYIRGYEQRQCPTCLRWYFHGEYGKGWSKGLEGKLQLYLEVRKLKP